MIIKTFRKVFFKERQLQFQVRPRKRTIKKNSHKKKTEALGIPSELESDEQLEAYRSYLVAADQKAQEDYDKNILTLSGGALGISFAFVNDFLPDNEIMFPTFLFLAWVSWGISIVCVLLSFYFSMKAFRKAIDQVDKGIIYTTSPGGVFSKVTSILNILSGLLFITGIVLIAIFVLNNMR